MSRSTAYPVHFIGLDVHVKAIAIAVAQEGRQEAAFLQQIPADVARLIKELGKLWSRDALRCAFEAGSIGYGLQRALSAAGFTCDLIAPSRIPEDPGDHVKTDKRDAIKLARFLR